MLLRKFGTQDHKTVYHENKPMYPGVQTRWTEKLKFVNPELEENIPIYRVLDHSGRILQASEDPKVYHQ